MMRRLFISAMATVVFAGVLSIQTASAQTAKKKVVRQEPQQTDSRRDVVRVDPVDGRKNQARVRYLPTGPNFRHVRVVERPVRDNRLVDTRTVFVRSADARPRVIVRFDDRRQNEIRSVIRLYREGHRDQAIGVWGEFVAGLANYDDPVDLDDIMLYVSRESCFREDNAVLFRAQKLAFLRDTADRLDDYIDQVNDRRSSLLRDAGGVSSDTLNDIDAELIRMRAEREVLAIHLKQAEDDYNRESEASRADEDRFGGVMYDLYHEAGLKISISAGVHRKYLRP